MSPKATINAVACGGDSTCSQIAAATIPKAKPARPVTRAAANVPTRKKARSNVRKRSMRTPCVPAATPADGGWGNAWPTRGGLGGGCLDLVYFRGNIPGKSTRNCPLLRGYLVAIVVGDEATREGIDHHLSGLAVLQGC